jgi:hypothetical protein
MNAKQTTFSGCIPMFEKIFHLSKYSNKTT